MRKSCKVTPLFWVRVTRAWFQGSFSQQCTRGLLSGCAVTVCWPFWTFACCCVCPRVKCVRRARTARAHQSPHKAVRKGASWRGTRAAVVISARDSSWRCAAARTGSKATAPRGSHAPLSTTPAQLPFLIKGSAKVSVKRIGIYHFV